MCLLQIIMFSILVTTEAFYVITGAVTSKWERYYKVLGEETRTWVLQGCPECSMEDTASRLKVKNHVLGGTLLGCESDSQRC